MRNRWWIVVVLTLAALVTVPGALLLGGGIAARPEPGATETAVARRPRSYLIPSSVRQAQNPMPMSPRALAEGRAHFADHGASCHANDGSGDTSLGRNLYPRAPDLRGPATQALTDGELFFIIENGVRLTGMPAWGGAGKPEESWKLVHFIRHQPTLTSEERAEMEQLNPRSAQEWRESQEEAGFLRGMGRAPSPRNHLGH